MKANQAHHRVATMCRVLGVSASGYGDPLRPAPALPRRRFLAGPGADISIRQGLEPLDHVAVVGKAGAEEMHQERARRVAGHRHRCRHGVASISPVMMSGGDALPRTPNRRPAHGRTPPPRGAKRAGGERAIDASGRYDYGSGTGLGGLASGARNAPATACETGEARE